MFGIERAINPFVGPMKNSVDVFEKEADRAFPPFLGDLQRGSSAGETLPSCQRRQSSCIMRSRKFAFFMIGNEFIKMRIQNWQSAKPLADSLAFFRCSLPSLCPSRHTQSRLNYHRIDQALLCNLPPNLSASRRSPVEPLTKLFSFSNFVLLYANGSAFLSSAERDILSQRSKSRFPRELPCFAFPLPMPAPLAMSWKTARTSRQ